MVQFDSRLMGVYSGIFVRGWVVRVDERMGSHITVMTIKVIEKVGTLVQKSMVL